MNLLNLSSRSLLVISLRQQFLTSRKWFKCRRNRNLGTISHRLCRRHLLEMNCLSNRNFTIFSPNLFNSRNNKCINNQNSFNNRNSKCKDNIHLQGLRHLLINRNFLSRNPSKVKSKIRDGLASHKISFITSNSM